MNILTTSTGFFKDNHPTYWFPRLLGILDLLLFTLLSTDVFVEDYVWWEMIVGFIMHMIPTFILAIALFIGWRNELYGSLVFLLLGVISTIFFNAWEELISFLIIPFPLFLIAGFFLYHWVLIEADIVQ